ncbi:T9SS type A sorting domain-containing protein [Flammeovirga yaeyamensis]|uniref:T9SS type A sorting domain-containing protein n=1 Tax=Flammeovirga yaeyamensis TaxID=367791 RepID=A0AAX1NA07_9BACT|nr:T9SS type A sorting domain-containing protein [Flammeovirga yaeyamensis]MBB3700516.1 hypothetical protein [Flammeovirga yaeyamensis]NMF36863.1 T9SS type A sorting domain-containing protein [Flammeovirga yaeyamensis]QWG02588.1 T9SS type A sorting domain-containing protein [Flammeovirga yaeyamensis]
MKKMKLLPFFMSILVFTFSNLFAKQVIHHSGGRYNRVVVHDYDTLQIDGNLIIDANSNLPSLYSTYDHTSPSVRYHEGRHGYIRVKHGGVLFVTGNIIIVSVDEDDETKVEGDLVVGGDLTINYRIHGDDDEPMNFKNYGTTVVAGNLNLNGPTKLDEDETLRFYNYGEMLVMKNFTTHNHVQIRTGTDHHHHPKLFVTGNTRFEGYTRHHGDDDEWSVIAPDHNHYKTPFTHVGTMDQRSQQFMTYTHNHHSNVQQVDNLKPLIDPHTQFLIDRFLGQNHIDISLPIEMETFTSKVKDDYVILHWATASESNSDHFELERSYDGQHYEKVRKDISAAGNSSVELKYNVIDNEVHNGHIYYRLSEVDFDGAVQSWSTEIIMRHLTETESPIVIYPNPSDREINIDFSSNETNTLEIDLVAASTGQKINLFQVNDGMGNHHIINVENINNGQYVLLIFDHGRLIKRQHMIIQHQ